ncbi:MAG: S1 family peptidase [Nitrospirota bacterium]
MMMTKFRISLLLRTVALLTLIAAWAAVPGVTTAETSLSEDVLNAVKRSVLEVVVPKPEQDSLQYEKPLPLDLLPFSVRTDKYYSIGTAFAISATDFVSAAHVMPIGNGSQFREVYLRDGQGKVYPIDQVLKYSRNRDFVVFTLKGWPAGKGLLVNTTPQMNQKVFAVGNALAEGIIIRDGLYTSSTPEEEEGAWNWLRFSAAASPGNSGGPLLDKNGNVIGVVLRKSENENLNYALPINEILKAPDKAVLHFKMKYMLDNMDMTSVDTFHKEMDLPSNYRDLDRNATETIRGFSSTLLKKLLADNRETLFPNGNGSTLLLNNNYNAIFPHIIMKGEDGNWDAFMPKDTRRADLGNNGFLSYGNIGRTYYLYIHKPDNVPLERFLGDSKLFMDQMLKGVYVYRQIGAEKIKIVSMGKAHDNEPFVDAFGRKWTIRTWKHEYNDRMFVVFSLPVPGGCVAMLRVDETGSVYDSHIPDLKTLADFSYLSYYGTFGEWKELLAQKDSLPSIFSSITLQIKNDRLFSFNSRSFTASYGPDLMQITDTSDLNLRFSYFMDRGTVVWDIDGIVIGDDKNNRTSYSIFRLARPPQDLPDTFQSNWKNVEEQKFPFNRSAYYKDEITVINSAYPVRPELYYTVTYLTNGKMEQEQMEKKLDGFLKNLNVHEDGPARPRKTGTAGK